MKDRNLLDYSTPSTRPSKPAWQRALELVGFLVYALIALVLTIAAIFNLVDRHPVSGVVAALASLLLFWRAWVYLKRFMR
jgi:hypothetical protein